MSETRKQERKEPPKPKTVERGGQTLRTTMRDQRTTQTR